VLAVPAFLAAVHEVLGGSPAPFGQAQTQRQFDMHLCRLVRVQADGDEERVVAFRRRLQVEHDVVIARGEGGEAEMRLQRRVFRRMG
jgi:hypothetical protein